MYWDTGVLAQKTIFDNYFVLNEKNDAKIQQIIECYKQHNLPITYGKEDYFSK